MTPCDPSRRPTAADQLTALTLYRELFTNGSLGGTDALHDLVTDAGLADCPACVAVSAVQAGLAMAAATAGEDYITGELSTRLLALVDGAEAEIRAML